MAKTEKIFYILEQVRLCLDRKDYIRRASAPKQGSLKTAPSCKLGLVALSCIFAQISAQESSGFAMVKDLRDLMISVQCSNNLLCRCGAGMGSSRC